MCLLALVLRHPAMAALELVGGGLAHVFVAAWAAQYLTDARLFWALGWVLVFAVLHSVFPLVRARVEPRTPNLGWAHLFPSAALLLMLALTKTQSPADIQRMFIEY